MHFSDIRLLIEILLPLITQVYQVTGECHETGWFGTDCHYTCHCPAGEPCDDTTGECWSKTCDVGWFGPACQYKVLELLDHSGNSALLAWATDRDETTCNDGIEASSITAKLKDPQPLSWMRLTLSAEVSHDNIRVQYSHGDLDSLVDCESSQVFKVDDFSYVVVCPTRHPAAYLRITGDVVEFLCSLHVSGGRNVALREEAAQSSLFKAHTANLAVDGNKHLESTCTNTNPSENRSHWNLTFMRPVMIFAVLIYTRVECCTDRIRGFQLHLYNDDHEVFTYGDKEPEAKAKYIIVPSDTLVSSVTSMMIVKRADALTLDLCEVEVFGESSCAWGFYGHECEGDCKCYSHRETCHVSTGGCSSGCVAGYMGEDCHTPCPLGIFGVGCRDNCSLNCHGGPSACSNVDGSCKDGCADGYDPPFCNTLKTRWGPPALTYKIIGGLVLFLAVLILFMLVLSSEEPTYDIHDLSEDYEPSTPPGLQNGNTTRHRENMGFNKARSTPKVPNVVIDSPTLVSQKSDNADPDTRDDDDDDEDEDEDEDDDDSSSNGSTNSEV